MAFNVTRVSKDDAEFRVFQLKFRRNASSDRLTPKTKFVEQVKSYRMI